MRTKAAAVGELLKATYNDWCKDEAPRLGAALAYYAVFSLAPLLVITTAIVGIFYRENSAVQIERQIEGPVGPEAARLLSTAIHNSKGFGAGILAIVIGLTIEIMGATGVFVELRSAMNRVFQVKPEKSRWSRRFSQEASGGDCNGTGNRSSAARVDAGKRRTFSRDAALQLAPAYCRLCLACSGYRCVHRNHNTIVRDAVSIHPGRPTSVERPLDRRGCDRGPLYDWRLPDRPLPGARRSRIHVWCGWYVDGASRVGVLHGPDCFFRCRVHAGVFETLRVTLTCCGSATSRGMRTSRFSPQVIYAARGGCRRGYRLAATLGGAGKVQPRHATIDRRPNAPLTASSSAVSGDSLSARRAVMYTTPANNAIVV